jgi:hypothetical protein
MFYRLVTIRYRGVSPEKRISSAATLRFAASRGAWVHFAPWRLWGLQRRQPERVDLGPLRLKFAIWAS